jgi:hypothetical protein
MAKRKNITELLTPATTGWTRWQSADLGSLQQEAVFETDGSFGAEAQRRVLALPATAAWMLPAWLKGAQEHLTDMAALHLEKMGVRVNDPAREMLVNTIASEEAAHLCSIIALKEQPAPLATTKHLPDQVTLSALCLPLPANSLVIWEELGRFVLAITVDRQLAYFSPLSARLLDDTAFSEINNICLQLGFQRVLGQIEKIVLWSEAGDLDAIQKSTGLTTHREEKPSPRLPATHLCALMPGDLTVAHAQQQKSARTRLIALTAGAIGAVCVAVLTGLTALALQQRNSLFEQMAALSPKSSKVEDHRRAWEEVASAVDPKRFPMATLLQCMEPAGAAQVAVTHFECTPDKVILRGRTETSSAALQYAQEIKEVESLLAYTWETPPPELHGDDSASFEVKGVRP